MLLKILEKSGLTPNAIHTLLLQVISIFLVVLSNILLSRWLGVYEFARYSYILSWLQVLVPVALLGLYDLALKELSILLERNKPAALRFIYQLLSETFFFSLILGAIMLFLAFGLQKGELYQNRYTLLVAMPTVVFFAFIMQIQAILRCYNQVIPSLLSEKIVRPFLIAVVVAVYWLRQPQEATALQAVRVTTLCTLGAAMFSTFLLWKMWKSIRAVLQNQMDGVGASYSFRVDRKAQLYLLVLSLLGIAFIRIDALLLGEMGHIQAVGVYSVATKFTDLMTIVLQTMTFMVVPRYAVLAENGAKSELQALVTRTARMIFGLTIPLFLGLLLFGRFFLGIHGAGFELGYPLLLVLGIVNLLYAFLGDNNYLLLMLGYSNIAFRCMLLGFVCAVILEVLLIPKYGMIGAAIGRGLGSLVMYFATAMMVWRKSGIIPAAFGRF